VNGGLPVHTLKLELGGKATRKLDLGLEGAATDRYTHTSSQAREARERTSEARDGREASLTYRDPYRELLRDVADRRTSVDIGVDLRGDVREERGRRRPATKASSRPEGSRVDKSRWRAKAATNPIAMGELIHVKQVDSVPTAKLVQGTVQRG